MTMLSNTLRVSAALDAQTRRIGERRRRRPSTNGQRRIIHSSLFICRINGSCLRHCPSGRQIMLGIAPQASNRSSPQDGSSANLYPESVIVIVILFDIDTTKSPTLQSPFKRHFPASNALQFLYLHQIDNIPRTKPHLPLKSLHRQRRARTHRQPPLRSTISPFPQVDRPSRCTQINKRRSF